MTSATSTRNAVCVSDAMQLHDLIAAALPYDTQAHSEPWERAARQAARVASVLMSHIGHMREREIEAMGALLLSQAPSVPLAVTVGRDCQIGWDAIITDSDQHARAGLGEATRPVVLGDRVWVGARAVILKGVTVGDGAVIAAGSVVTRDVPANTLVAGQPARVVRELPPTSGPAPLTVPQR